MSSKTIGETWINYSRLTNRNGIHCIYIKISLYQYIGTSHRVMKGGRKEGQADPLPLKYVNRRKNRNYFFSIQKGGALPHVPCPPLLYECPWFIYIAILLYICDTLNFGHGPLVWRFISPNLGSLVRRFISPKVH